MWNAIWEFFFCPQHGIVIQCWYMIPLMFAALLAYGKQAITYIRIKYESLLGHGKQTITHIRSKYESLLG